MSWVWLRHTHQCGIATGSIPSHFISSGQNDRNWDTEIHDFSVNLGCLVGYQWHLPYSLLPAPLLGPHTYSNVAFISIFFPRNCKVSWLALCDVIKVIESVLTHSHSHLAAYSKPLTVPAVNGISWITFFHDDTQTDNTSYAVAAGNKFSPHYHVFTISLKNWLGFTFWQNKGLIKILRETVFCCSLNSYCQNRLYTTILIPMKFQYTINLI